MGARLRAFPRPPYHPRMSHFTTVQTQMVEAEYLLAALKDLGYTAEKSGPVRGFAGSNTTGEFKITTGSKGYDIGFRKSGDRYEMVADWWGIRDVNQNEFVRRLTQRYAYHAARAKLQEQGFDLVQEEQQQGGGIHLVLRRVQS